MAIENLDRVFTYVSSRDKFEAFDEIIAKCAIFDELPDKDGFAKSVHRREKLQSTGIGHGVAIAHGKISHLDKCHIALGCSREGIVFDEKYPEPVKLIFVIASSRTKQAEYLHAVSNILSWVYDSEFRKSLMDGNYSAPVTEFLEHLSAQQFIARP